MRYTFVQPASFVAEWRRLRLTDEDLAALEAEIMEQPEVGAVMRGTGGLRKMRFSPASSGRGKSGSLRICYVCFRDFATVYLLLLFRKNEQANLAPAERQYFRRWIASLRRKLHED